MNLIKINFVLVLLYWLTLLYKCWDPKTGVKKEYLCGNQGNDTLQNCLSESRMILLEMELVKFALPHSLCMPGTPRAVREQRTSQNTEHILPHYYTYPPSSPKSTLQKMLLFLKNLLDFNPWLFFFLRKDTQGFKDLTETFFSSSFAII